MSNTSRKLSSDEVSALMEGLQSGEITANSGLNNDVEVTDFTFGSDNLESARAKATGDESEEKIDVGSVMPGFASSNEEEDEAAAGKINTSALGKNVANNPENESLKELAKFLGISSSVIDSQPKRRIIGSVIARYISLVNTNYADISKELFGINSSNE